jgi:hypothetical protein
MKYLVFIRQVSELQREIGSEFLALKSQYSRVSSEKIRINTSWQF